MKKTFGNFVLTCAAIATLLVGAGQVKADFIAFSNAAGPYGPPLNIGIQNWPGNLGLDFDVNSPITVTQLGVFTNGLATLRADVGIFDRTTGLLVAPSVTITGAGGTQLAGDYFVAVTPFSLGVGSYSVVSIHNPNYNQGFFNNVFNPTSTQNSGSGLISFVNGGRYDGAGSLAFPTILDGGPTNRYNAGTFQFHAVPEPSTLALAGLGGLGLAIGAYRRRKADAAV